MTDEHWHGRIFIFQNERGQDLVSTSPPQAKQRWPRVKVFSTSGPYCPLGAAEPELVVDASQWMKKLNAQGFAFVLSGAVLKELSPTSSSN